MPSGVPPAPARTPAAPAWPRLVGLLWLLGAVAAALPVAAGWGLAARRLRRCTPVTDPAVLALAAEAGRQIGVRRPVALRSGPRVIVPATFGLLRPTVLLPDGAGAWPAERLRVALLHELAHVRRGDWAAQTAARLACAIFWHNPLVWPAARRLRAEAERACDDLVLSAGVPAPDYAQHLLALAGALSGAGHPLPLAVPMAGRGPLESRLRALLTARPRRAPSRRRAAAALLLALGVLVPLAMLRPAARAARQTAPPLVLAAPSLTPPKAARPAPPVHVSTIPSRSVPKGVPPMKPPTAIKTAALAALAAGLALPAAHAQPTPAPHAAPTVSSTNPFTSSAFPPPIPPPAADALPWNKIVLQHAKLRTIMAQMPWGPEGKKPKGVKHIFYLLGDNALLVHATPAGLAQVREVVKRLDVAPEATPAVAPRQVQLKFEWVSSAGTPGTAPQKDLDALTFVAQEGQRSQVSSRHLRSGVNAQETISVLPRVEEGGVVVLDITERSGSTAGAGDTASSATENDRARQGRRDRSGRRLGHQTGWAERSERPADAVRDAQHHPLSPPPGRAPRPGSPNPGDARPPPGPLPP